MTKEQILLSAIKKAEQNGYDSLYDIDFGNFIREKGYVWEYGEDKWRNRNQDIHINEILFDHEFAKAFWEEGESDCDCDGYKTCYIDCASMNSGWEYHLQKLAISEDRIQYLKEFL